ncbi:MAG: hypothetical protein LUD74_01340 [Tannerellaceae bacterium]|nr:hypothetical protein [Tannerellaceae bacterium]
MEMPKVITYQLKKEKKIGLIATFLVSGIAGIGIFYLAGSLRYGSGRFFSLLVGVFLLLVATLCLLGYIHFHKENFTAMFITPEGIRDMSTGHRIGLVKWEDVEEIKVMDDLSSNLKRKYIVLKLKNPDEYIAREPGNAKRRSLEIKNKFYGSPICFSNRALECTFDELKASVYTMYEQYKQQSRQA